MPESVWDTEVQTTLDQASKQEARLVYVGNRTVEVLTPFPSPIDWRDSWIYFMMVDRFNNPAAPPHHQPWNQPWGDYQGGTFAGIQQQLDYLQELGVGALWLSPLLKNCQFSPGYHGYGMQNFLAIEPRGPKLLPSPTCLSMLLCGHANCRGIPFSSVSARTTMPATFL